MALPAMFPILQETRGEEKHALKQHRHTMEHNNGLNTKIEVFILSKMVAEEFVSWKWCKQCNHLIWWGTPNIPQLLNQKCFPQNRSYIETHLSLYDPHTHQKSGLH